jgi:hypothetical protein
LRHDTFGDEQLWTGALRRHEAIAKLDPKTALSRTAWASADASMNVLSDASTMPAGGGPASHAAQNNAKPATRRHASDNVESPFHGPAHLRRERLPLDSTGSGKCTSSSSCSWSHRRETE